jgi:hypothetical protein
MKRTKPKMKMFPYGNKNPGPGREQAEKEAAERRKAFEADDKHIAWGMTRVTWEKNYTSKGWEWVCKETGERRPSDYKWPEGHWTKTTFTKDMVP